MLNVILSLGLGAALVVALVAWIRAAQGRRHHQIDAADIHPDLAAGEELLRDVLQEMERQTKP